MDSKIRRSLATTIIVIFLVFNVLSILLFTYYTKAEGENSALDYAKRSMQEIVNEKGERIAIRFERLIVLSSDGDITLDGLPDEMRASALPGEAKTETGLLKNATRSFEKKLIEQVLESHRGNVTKTAEELGIARKNLYKKLSDYGISYKG